MHQTVYILLGSNLGDRERKLRQAIEKLEHLEGLEITAISSIYLSVAQQIPEADAPPFMNQVVKGDYCYSPNELLNALELIEQQLGRTGKGEKLSRTIDLDILLFGDQIIETERLSIPHRELTNRAFAMVPLLEIDPGLVHPVTKTAIADFVDDEDAAEVQLYKDYVARQV
jgi:2-amino-4-hydroxy-6-hydroxymethyldihydropteridine diphosphokinase